MLHRPLEIADNKFPKFVELMLYKSHKKQKTLKYPRVLHLLLPVSNLADKFVTIIGYYCKKPEHIP